MRVCGVDCKTEMIGLQIKSRNTHKPKVVAPPLKGKIGVTGRTDCQDDANIKIGDLEADFVVSIFIRPGKNIEVNNGSREIGDIG